MKINIFVVHGNLTWAFTMLFGDIKHQQKQNKSNSQCSSFGPSGMDLYYSHLRTLAFFLFLSDSVSPTKTSTSWASSPQASLVTSQRKSRFPQNCASWLWPWQRGPPPPVSTQRKIFSCGGKSKPHPNFWHLQEGNWLSVTPVVRVTFFFLSFFNCLSVT